MYAMLSLHLEKSATLEQRRQFFQYLRKERWTQVPKVAVAWSASFKDTATESSIISTARTDVINAARQAGVRAYQAVIQIGHTRPSTF